MFQTHTKKWLARKSQSFIAFSRVSGRYVKHFSDAKVQIFWLALSARSILFFSSFLFLMNKTISRVLRTQSWTYCTDKQWLISNVYIEIWEESYVFNADIKKSARSLRSLAILYTFSPVSNASSFNKAIYHEHIKWTNTRTYCTDKNMLLTNLTIARFQRKIRKFRLARLQSVTYAGTYSYCKKKKKKKSHTINYYGKSGDSRTPGPRQGLYTRNCNWRNYSFYHSWRPSWMPLFAENSRASGGSAPWAPGRGSAPAPRQGP